MPPQLTKAFASQAAVGAAEGAQDALHTGARSLALHSPDFLNCVLCPYPSTRRNVLHLQMETARPSKDKRIWVPNKQLRICYIQHGSLCVLILRVLH